MLDDKIRVSVFLEEQRKKNIDLIVFGSLKDKYKVINKNSISIPIDLKEEQEKEKSSE